MASSTEIPRSFRLYVTHVDGEGHFLKISGQLDQQASLMIEALFENSRENLEKGVGAVSPGSIHEGVICAAKYKDGAYYRAKVINMTNIATGLVGVHFIDFGNKDIISLSTIRFLDSYDPMFLQLRGQATDYYLSRVINLSGRWEEPVLMKLQTLLCYQEYQVTLDVHTLTLPLISIQFKGNDLSTHLVSIRFGMAIPLQKQEVLLLQVSDSQHAPNWQSNYMNDAPTFSEHVPFLLNQNFPTNPASAMRLQQNVALPFNGSIPATPSLVSNRLRNHKVSRTAVNLKAPARQPQQAPGAGVVLSTPPPATTAPFPAAKSTSPKHSMSFTSKLLEVNTQYKVFVSYAEEGPELFAVQLASENEKLQTMMDDINRRPHSSLSEPPLIGDVCLGRMSGDRIICRAVVVNLSGSQCKLFFVDFGDTEMVSYYDIFDIPDEFVKPNVFAMRFCLSGVKKLEKGPHLTEAFKQLASGKLLTLKVVPPEGPPLIQYGELYLDNKNILDLLVANMKDKLQFKWPGMLGMGTKHTALVSYVDSCIKFYIQLCERIEELNAVMEAVKAHCESSEAPPAPAVGAACCARFPEDGNWYRALVQNVSGERVTVVYVDYGNEQEVEVADIRTITPQLMQLPAVAMKCALKGFESRPVESKTSNQLEMLALEKSLSVQVVGALSTDTMLVTLVDESVAPPLDVARKMQQLSQPRASHEVKPAAGARREPAESPPSPEGAAPTEDGQRRSFRRERSFKDEQKPYHAREGGPERRFAGRADTRPDRTDARPDRNDTRPDRTDTRPDRNDRRGGAPRGSPPTPAAPTAAPAPPTDDDWEETPAPPTNNQAQAQPHGRDYNRDRDYRPHHREDEERRGDEWGSRAGAGREQRGERRGRGGARGGRGARGGGMTPRARAERSFDDSTSEKSGRSQGSAGGGPRARARPPARELPDPVPLDTPFAQPEVELGAQVEVAVTWIVSPENFYTQLLSLQPAFLEMMHGIPALYTGVRPYAGEIPVGASVLARYPADGVLYRATVLELRPFGRLVVQYVDFGNKQAVEARDVWQLDARLAALPALALPCALAGVAPPGDAWCADERVDRCFNAPRYQAVFQPPAEGRYRVSLWHDGASVADQLVAKGLAAPAEEPLTVTLKDEPIELALLAGQQLVCRVTHVASHDEFYLHLDLEKAARVEETVAGYDVDKLRAPAAELVAEGTHCTVRHAGRVHRAVLRDVADPHHIRALLADYGNEVTVHIDDVLILPSELSVYYYQALRCALHNYSQESRPLLTAEQLRERLVGNKFLVYINDVDGITLLTTLYELETGAKVCVFEPDEGAHEAVSPLCARAVLNYSWGRAYLAHGGALHALYLQHAGDGDALAALLDALYAHYETGTAEPLTTFEEETLCAAKSADGNWYRATVQSVQDDQVTVHYPDYGNSETLGKDALKKLDPRFHEPCSLALLVGLGLEPLRDDALDKLREWIGDREVQVTLSFGDVGWLANLHLDGDDLGLRLMSEGLAAPQRPAAEPAPEPPAAAPPSCVAMYISHIDTPGLFWLQPADKVEEIEAIQAELATHADSYEALEAREAGALCAARYSQDGLWYRAVILDADADIVTVRFLDYGNTDVLDNEPGAVRVLPPALRDQEPGAARASVNAVPTGTGEWSEPGTRRFVELAGDLSAPVDVLVVLRDAVTYADVYVAGLNLTDALVSEGHAARADAPAGDLPACYASHVNSPSEFWIQLEAATAELQAMEAAMVDAAAFPLLEAREEGALCAALYPEDGLWYRAQVVVDGSEGTEVLFMDYGNASIAGQLRALPAELRARPPLSRKCALQRPRHVRAWTRAAELAFNELAAEGATVFRVQFVASGDVSIVELFSENGSVTEHLAALCEERPQPAGRERAADGKLCYVAAADEVYVHRVDALPDVDRVTEELTAAADWEPAETLAAGALCAAFWPEDERWYRARLLELAEGGHRVHFLDYGNSANCDEFRRLPDEVAALRPLAERCRLTVPPAHRAALRDELDRLAAEYCTLTVEYLETRPPLGEEAALVRLSVEGVELLDALAARKPGAPGDGAAQLDETMNTTVPSEPEMQATETSARQLDTVPVETDGGRKEEATEMPLGAPVDASSERGGDEFEDAEENERASSPRAELDESVDSTDTVIENTSFEGASDDTPDEPHRREVPSSPEQDAPDTGYTSAGELDKSSGRDADDTSAAYTDTEKISTESNTASEETSEETEKDTVKETEKDIVKETEKDTAKEIEKDLAKETEKSIDKDTEKNTAKETEKDTAKEIEKDLAKETEKSIGKVTEKNTVKETEKDTAEETEKDTAKEIEKEMDKEIETKTVKMAKDTVKETEKDTAKEMDHNKVNMEIATEPAVTAAE